MNNHLKLTIQDNLRDRALGLGSLAVLDATAKVIYTVDYALSGSIDFARAYRYCETFISRENARDDVAAGTYVRRDSFPCSVCGGMAYVKLDHLEDGYVAVIVEHVRQQSDGDEVVTGTAFVVNVNNLEAVSDTLATVAELFHPGYLTHAHTHAESPRAAVNPN